MTTATTHPTSASKCPHFENFASDVVVQAGAGALGAYLFTIINPAAGAVFGALYAASRYAVDSIADQPSCNPTTQVLKIAKLALKIFASLAIASAATTALGFPLSLGVAASLALVSVLTGLFIRNCVQCCDEPAPRSSI